MDSPLSPHEKEHELHRIQYHHTWSTSSLAFVISLMMITAMVIVAETGPLIQLLGPGSHAVAAGMHAMVGFLQMVVSTIALYLAWRLFMGRLKAFPDLQLVTTVSSTLSLLTIISGFWIYAPYQTGSGAPKDHFLKTAPHIHQIFFEYKDHIALFTLPLMVAATFILWRYGAQSIKRDTTRTAIALLIALHYFFLITAFGLGIGISKLKGV